MKIALISHLFPTTLHPYQAKFIADQLRLFEQEESISFDLIVPTPYSVPLTQRRLNNESPLLWNTEQHSRVPYLSFPKKRFPMLIRRSLSNALLAHLRKQQYDLVHLHWLYPDGLSIPALKRAGLKTALTIHGSDWYKNIGNADLMKLLEETLQCADLILCSGPKLLSDIGKQFPEILSKCSLIYNTVDTDRYLPAASSDHLKTIRTQLGWNNDRPQVLAVANLMREKGVDLLIEAARDFSDLDFHIIGRNDHDSFAKTILSQIEEHSLSNVIIHPPVIPDQLVAYYQAADFMVLPSRREGFNVSILEAMSCGLPVVATNVGGNSEVVVEGTGILCTGISSDAIKQAIGLMKTTYMDYQAPKIRQSILSKFGSEASLERYIAAYTGLLNR